MRKILIPLLMAACVLLHSGCYVLDQALHQNNLINSRRPVDDVLDDPSVDPKIRTRLTKIEGVLAFAKTHGLHSEGAYTYFVDVPTPVVSFLVQAAEVDRLEPVTWWFPIVGRVPYLGFFDKAERDAEAIALEKQGYDVARTGATAFSSLGWFDDPIYSTMLSANEAQLAHVFFHELTHRTLWVAGSAPFNENLAEYCAEILTKEYLIALGHGPAIAKYENDRADRKLFKEWLKDLREALEKIYGKTPKQQREGILKEKKSLFTLYLSESRWPHFLDPKGYERLRTKDWNNATVLAESLYSPETDRFAKAHACLGSVDIGVFLTSLRRAAKEFSDQFQALDSLCSKR